MLPVGVIWHDLVWGLAAATMIWGNVVALLQTDIKRLLAYSSIAHAGYILVGVLASNPAGQSAVMYYMLVYTFMNLGAFGVIILLTKTGREYNSLRDLDGLARKHPLEAVMMSIFMFSLAGIPPAAGFIGKLFLFQAAIQAHLYGLAALGLLASVVGVYYYLMVIVRMWMVAPESEVGTLARAPLANIAVVLSAVLTIGLFFFPTLILDKFKNGYLRMDTPSPAIASPAATIPAADSVQKTASVP